MQARFACATACKVELLFLLRRPSRLPALRFGSVRGGSARHGVPAVQGRQLLAQELGRSGPVRVPQLQRRICHLGRRTAVLCVFHLSSLGSTGRPHWPGSCVNACRRAVSRRKLRAQERPLCLRQVPGGPLSEPRRQRHLRELPAGILQHQRAVRVRAVPDRRWAPLRAFAGPGSIRCCPRDPPIARTEFTNVTGSDKCTRCPIGRHASRRGMSRCDLWCVVVCVSFYLIMPFA